ncbi:MAG TPA: hypothetical protein VMT16_04145 [Thermoanaerobaculia bacterium]|nr:hypothetical protein [Thermoanaerobaculia bacterium]
MKGRTLAPLLVVLLAATLAAQVERAIDRLQASRAVWRVERGLAAARQGARLPRPLVARGIAALRSAEERDPLSIEARAARGDLYLLLGSFPAAREVYAGALALEPHPELYLHLGLAEWHSGEREAARRHFADAVALQRLLWRGVPEEVGMPPPPGMRSRRASALRRRAR